MPLLYHLTTTPDELQAWHAQAAAQAAAGNQTVLYDSGCCRLVRVTTLDGTRVLIRDDPGPIPLSEHIADVLAARSQLEDTRVPRQRFYLGFLYLTV